jgi:transcriptional regulator with XRE-family HTH domain
MTRPELPADPEASKPFGEEDPAYYEALGRAIKVARTQQDLGRRALAERAGVSYAYLADIETGRGRPSSKALLAIAAALGRTPAELLQEAELYGSLAGFAPSEEAPAPAPSWFHDSAALIRADRSVSAEETVAAHRRSAREGLRRLSRNQIVGKGPQERAVLAAMLEELSDDDVRAVLALVNHLRRR